MRRLALLLGLGLVAPAAPACDDECAAATYAIAGVWSSAFHCSSTGPEGCFTGTDTLTIIQASDAAGPSREVSFSDGVGGQFSGTLCGNVFSWSGGGTGYSESGTWVFANADRFVKSTAYANDGESGRGCCSGDGVRQGAMTPTPPAQCPPTSCSMP